MSWSNENEFVLPLYMILDDVQYKGYSDILFDLNIYPEIDVIHRKYCRILTYN